MPVTFVKQFAAKYLMTDRYHILLFALNY